jgi:phosphate transport system permease protein
MDHTENLDVSAAYPRQNSGLRGRARPGEVAIQVFLFCAGLFSILVTIGIVYELGKEAVLLFQMPGFSILESITTTKWQPHTGQFGIWPLVGSTLITSLLAMVTAAPLGLAVAIYLSEYATPRSKSILKPLLELLAGVPTIVFGSDVVEIYNMGSAGLVMGILILPLIASMTEDALSAVPRSLREAAYAIGATRLEVSLRVVVPAALSGIAAALIIGISRAIGETMIVAIAAGAGPKFTFNPFLGAETITGHIVRISGGDLSYDSVDYNSIFALALLLFLITLALNVISQRIVRRFREVYE